MINTNMNSAVSFGQAEKAKTPKKAKKAENHKPRTQQDNLKRIAVNTGVTAGVGAGASVIGAKVAPKIINGLFGQMIKGFRKNGAEGLSLKSPSPEMLKEMKSHFVNDIMPLRKQLISSIKGMTMKSTAIMAGIGALTAVVIGTVGSVGIHGLKDMFRTDKKHK